MTSGIFPPDVAERVIDISYQPDRRWSPDDYLDVLYLRLPRANGFWEKIGIEGQIETAEKYADDIAAGKPGSLKSWIGWQHLCAS